VEVVNQAETGRTQRVNPYTVVPDGVAALIDVEKSRQGGVNDSLSLPVKRNFYVFARSPNRNFLTT